MKQLNLTTFINLIVIIYLIFILLENHKNMKEIDEMNKQLDEIEQRLEAKQKFPTSYTPEKIKINNVSERYEIVTT